MTPTTRISRSLSVASHRAGARWRRSTKWLRDRRRSRLAVPPATGVNGEMRGRGVFEIRLVGGDRRNVLGRSTIERIESLAASPPHGTRVIVITAEPPDFCAGYDLIEAAQGAPEDLIAHEGNFAGLRQSTLPVVVALQGNVIGGGLELALSADVRVASPETRLAVPAGRLGLVYSEAGIRLVVSAVGDSVARAMFLAGRELSAEDALGLGVVSEIVGREQLRDRAIALATAIASWSLTASTGNRQILDVVADRSTADAQALRTAAFDPHGDLAATIADFVARRARSTPRPLSPTPPRDPIPGGDE